MGGSAGYSFLAEGNSSWFGSQTLRTPKLAGDFALVRWSDLREEKLNRRCCRETLKGFPSLATRFKHLLNEESHPYHPSLLKLHESWSVCLCTCCISDFPWSMSCFLNTVGVVAVCNSDHEIRSWMRERQGKFPSELVSRFALAVCVSSPQVRWLHSPSLAFSQLLCSRTNHWHCNVLCSSCFSYLEQPPCPSAKGFPVSFKCRIKPRFLPSPAFPLASY